jgi:hypothetical protein
LPARHSVLRNSTSARCSSGLCRMVPSRADSSAGRIAELVAGAAVAADCAGHIGPSNMTKLQPRVTIGDRPKISVAAFGTALVILFNVAYGVWVMSFCLLASEAAFTLSRAR